MGYTPKVNEDQCHHILLHRLHESYVPVITLFTSALMCLTIVLRDNMNCPIRLSKNLQWD